MLKESLGTVNDRDAAGFDVLIDFPLHGLPPLGPEPSLVGGNRQDGPKLHPAIRLLDDLDLGPWFVQMEASTQAGGKSDRPPRLDGEEVGLHAMQHNCNAATVNPVTAGTRV